jgi:hypothetical protein
MLVPAERAILAPPPGLKLDGVDRRTGRDVAQRQVVARLDVGRGPVSIGSPCLSLFGARM